jgi:hypothetical protein
VYCCPDQSKSTIGLLKDDIQFFQVLIHQGLYVKDDWIVVFLFLLCVSSRRSILLSLLLILLLGEINAKIVAPQQPEVDAPFYHSRIIIAA